jgi:hypothetical protein
MVVSTHIMSLTGLKAIGSNLRPSQEMEGFFCFIPPLPGLPGYIFFFLHIFHPYWARMVQILDIPHLTSNNSHFPIQPVISSGQNLSKVMLNHQATKQSPKFLGTA